MRDEGYETNTINVGGYWLPTAFLGRAAPLINAAGAINDTVLYDKAGKKFGELTTAEQIERIAMSVGRGLKDYPLMDSLATVDNLRAHPGDTIAALLGETAAQYSPAILRTIQASKDPYVRRGERYPDIPFSQRVVETFKARSGIGREDLPRAQDILGRDVVNPRQGAAAFGPRVGQDRPDPIIQAYLDADVAIGDPPRQISIGELNARYDPPEMTPEERRRWNTLRGDAIIRQVTPLLEKAAWATATPEEKTKALEQRRADAAAYAHRTLRAEIGDAELKRRMETQLQRRVAS
jgi:hypothetical protein